MSSRQRRCGPCCWRGEQDPCEGEALIAEAIGEQAAVADAHETPWQHTEEKAAQELWALRS